MRLLNSFRDNISTRIGRINNFRERIRTTSESISELNEWQQLFFKENNFENIIKRNYISNFLISIPEIKAIKDKESFEKAQNYNNSVIQNELGLRDTNEPFIHLKNDDTEEEIFVTVITNNVNSSISVYVSRESENHLHEQIQSFDLNTGRIINGKEIEEIEI